jgi:hypothetical protein
MPTELATKERREHKEMKKTEQALGKWNQGN